MIGEAIVIEKVSKTSLKPNVLMIVGRKAEIEASAAFKPK
jgi:hypothetical protein